MKNRRLNIILLFSVITLFSQEIPTIKVAESNLGLQEVSIKVEVIGNIATTTYDMLFYNDTDRILEGELSFPLGENQNVTHFALDLNGKLRDAVVVEKELGRVAYENTIRQKIDPALLEQTKGNNYKARIYPIPAKGTKRVVLSYQQELIYKNGAHFFHLPLHFKNKLHYFKMECIVFEQKTEPIVDFDNYNEGFEFTKWNENYKLSFEKFNYLADKAIDIKIPIQLENEKLIVSKDVFYFYKNIVPNTKPKKKPTKIMLLWDVSLSMKDRNFKNEILVLKNYIKYLNIVEITVRKFSNTFIKEEKFSIKNGNSIQLIKFLKNSVYDGATSYNNVLLMPKKYNECLLFTDGMDNLGMFNNLKTSPVYLINSISTSNHNALRKVGVQSGGNYINLNTVSIDKANELLIKEPFRFLGVTQKGSKEIEIYPNRITNITSDFSISGKNFKNNDTIELQFGYGNKVTKRVKISLKKAAIKNELITTVWAQKKLASLVINKEKNREEIIGLSKEHQLISPYTSLIVLDRVEDYVRYNIEPPKELQVVYKRLLKEKKEEDKFSFLQEMKENLWEEYEEINNWLETKFRHKKTKKPKKKSVVIRTNTNVTQASQVDSNIALDPNLRIISGVVSDEMGPISDISIKVNGTTKGTVTDFDGKYAINANRGDILNFTHVSYMSIHKTVNESTTVNVIMGTSSSVLDEVIITSMPIKRESKSSYSVSTIKNESATTGFANILAGQVSGLVIQNGNGATGSTSKIQIRGVNSISTQNPLYIIDGVLYEKNQDLDTKKVASISVLKGADAIAIYGTKAANGIIIITTKKGLQNKSDDIKNFNEMVEEKLALKGWNPNTSYIEKINEGKTVEECYAIYLKIRKQYRKQPTFYLDVSDYFLDKNQVIALRILSNIAEIDIENYELLRAIAYKFEALGNYEQALYLYEELLKIRPEDIQTYRDLALCYQSVGKYQMALDLFYKIVNGSLVLKDKEQRFDGIEAITYVEMNNLISKFKRKLDISKVDKKYINNFETDVRVVIDWNHNDTDIDLWVFDPNNEKCFYSHTKTEIGGRISKDMTEGFGPEEFMLKKAIKGQYRIKAKYYNDNVQKISGPTILKVTIFKNYGKKKESKKVRVFTLDKESEEVIEIGKLKI